MTTLEQFRSVKETIAKARQEMQDLAHSTFRSCSKSIFDEFPALESFSWTQYRSYYCDGGPCSFYAHYEDGMFLVNGTVCEGIPEDNPLYAAGDKIYNLLSQFSRDDYQELFGEDAEVTVTRDKITVEQYTDHE
jgi:hypothetical protein